MAVERLPLPVRPSTKDRAALRQRAPGALVGRRRRLAGTVYLCLDLSASMADAGKMPQLLRGSIGFFYRAWHADFAIGVVGFASSARVLAGATRNPYRFQRCLAGLEPNGRTAMADGLRLACARLRFRRGRRVIALITDGMPNSREATLEAATAARAQGVEVVAVGTGSADEAFLQALTPRPELAQVAVASGFGDAIERSAASVTDAASGRRSAAGANAATPEADV